MSRTSFRNVPLVFLASLLMFASGSAQEPETSIPIPKSPKWGPIIEPDFPFFSSVVDARKLGNGFPSNNLTPRGLVLNLGQGTWAAFDVDLLRMSVVWEGEGLTPNSMSHGSYHQSGVKVPEGQDRLPTIEGSALLANGIYPGWQIGTVPDLTDPRMPSPDPKEVGRGPLPRHLGRFLAVRLLALGARLEYEIGDSLIYEEVKARNAGDATIIECEFRINQVTKPLLLLLGRNARPAASRPLVSLEPRSPTKAGLVSLEQTVDHLFLVRVPPSSTPVQFLIRLTQNDKAPASPAPEPRGSDSPAPRRWNETLRTALTSNQSKDAYVTDPIELPLHNPWRRNIRLADIAFLSDGRAALVTFDGDVWMVRGLGSSEQLRWSRYSSGFHEPLGLCVRGEEVFVFDRNGIWRLRDSDQNGEADVHELFSNAFTQTAETREFASGIRPTPDGAFIIAKGGQRGSTVSTHAGSILRIAPDGQSSQVLAYGLRQPFIGVNSKTGWITASDQEGHYVPTTPLHWIRDGQFHGFLPLILPNEKYPAPIANPMVWIPRSVNPSGAGQVWLTGARMGSLNDALIHLGYYRPEVFLVRRSTRSPETEAAVVSLTRDLRFPLLAGAVNPVDGQLYVTGFQIWGSEAPQISGLACIRYTGAPSPFPREVLPMRQGILVRFDMPLDPVKAANPGNYLAERWNYQRTANYGSPHFTLDGRKGQDSMIPSSAYLSRDAKSVFVGIPEMRPVMQLRIAWSLTTRTGEALSQSCYLTPYQLPDFHPEAEGFAPLEVDLSSRPAQTAPPEPVSVKEGKRLAELMGCVACHSIDGSTLAKVGPTWLNLFNRERSFADGSHGQADEAYLLESIRSPSAKIVSGYEKSDAGMPTYEGVLSDSQVESIIAYIKSLHP